ncbi:hypothetical protein ACFX1X_036239 [Malus domestica]
METKNTIGSWNQDIMPQPAGEFGGKVTEPSRGGKVREFGDSEEPPIDVGVIGGDSTPKTISCPCATNLGVRIRKTGFPSRVGSSFHEKGMKSTTWKKKSRQGFEVVMKVGGKLGVSGLLGALG